jgi:hypothetical protein
LHNVEKYVMMLRQGGDSDGIFVCDYRVGRCVQFLFDVYAAQKEPERGEEVFGRPQGRRKELYGDKSQARHRTG